jgi:hypothetical protein
MSTWAWVITGWVITVVVIVGYVALVLQRGRSLSRQVPPEEQRWM